MNKMLGPTGLVLVGATFICLYLVLATASGSGQASLPDLPSQLRESVFCAAFVCSAASRF